tara:strand:- start:969 stop:1568 length:600 start_codon:yes stop_codon:yes gene_type:complete
MRIPPDGYESSYPLPDNCMFMMPYFRYHVEEWQDRKEEILSDLSTFHDEVILKDPAEINDTCHTSYYEDTDYSEFKPFIDLLGPYLQRLSTEAMGKGFYRKPIDNITRIWFQVQEEGEFHSLHNHGANGWSAVFYADYDEEVHEATKFYSSMFTCNGEIMHFQPGVREGDIIIFPSQVFHESPVNRSEKSRTIISLNMT